MCHSKILLNTSKYNNKKWTCFCLARSSAVKTFAAIRIFSKIVRDKTSGLRSSWPPPTSGSPPWPELLFSNSGSFCRPDLMFARAVRGRSRRLTSCGGPPGCFLRVKSVGWAWNQFLKQTIEGSSNPAQRSPLSNFHLTVTIFFIEM